MRAPGPFLPVPPPLPGPEQTLCARLLPRPGPGGFVLAFSWLGPWCQVTATPGRPGCCHRQESELTTPGLGQCHPANRLCPLWPWQPSFPSPHALGTPQPSIWDRPPLPRADEGPPRSLTSSLAVSLPGAWNGPWSQRETDGPSRPHRLVLQFGGSCKSLLSQLSVKGAHCSLLSWQRSPEPGAGWGQGQGQVGWMLSSGGRGGWLPGVGHPARI